MAKRIKVRAAFSNRVRSVKSEPERLIKSDRYGQDIRVFRNVYDRAKATLFLGIDKVQDYTPLKESIEEAVTIRETWEQFVDRMVAVFHCDALDAGLRRGVSEIKPSASSFARMKTRQPVAVFSSPVDEGHIYAIAFDYDKFESLEQYQQLVERLQSSHYELIAHTTTSHTEEEPKVHVIIPLYREIKSADLKYAISHLIASLGLPTCFDNRVFRPGWSLFLPEVRRTQGFIIVNNTMHAQTGVVPKRFDYKKDTNVEDNKEALAKYRKFLGSIARVRTSEDLQDIALSPTTFNGGMRLLSQEDSESILSQALGTHSPRPHYIEYANDTDYGNRVHAFDSVRSRLIDAFLHAQTRYAIRWITPRIDGVRQRNSSSPASKALLPLTAPCPVCAAKGNKRDLYGTIDVITGFTRLRCASLSCGNEVTVYAPYYSYGSHSGRSRAVAADMSREAYVIDIASVLFKFFVSIYAYPIQHEGRPESFVRYNGVMVSLRSVFLSSLHWKQLRDFEAFVASMPIAPISCVLDRARFPLLESGKPSFAHVTTKLATAITNALPRMSSGETVRRASRLERVEHRGHAYILNDDSPEHSLPALLSKFQYPFGIDFRSLSSLRATRIANPRNFGTYFNDLIKSLAYAVLPISKVRRFLDLLPPIVIFKVPHGLHRGSAKQSVSRARQMINMMRMRGSHVILFFDSNFDTDSISHVIEKLGMTASENFNLFTSRRIGLRFRDAEANIEAAGERARAACASMQEAGVAELRKALAEVSARKYEAKQAKKSKKSVSKPTKKIKKITT